MHNGKVADWVDGGSYYNTTVVVKEEEVCTWYGMSYVGITESDIEALKSGNFLYWTDGEYATLLGLEKGEEC